MQAGTFVGAVFAPHHGENAELRVGGFAAEDRNNSAVLFRRKLMRRNNVRSDRCHFLFGRERIHKRAENYKSVGRSHQRIGRAFRMRHHAKHISPPIENSGNVPDGPVIGRDVPERDAILILKLIEHPVLGEVVAFTVGNRDMSEPDPFCTVRERANLSSRRKCPRACR